MGCILVVTSGEFKGRYVGLNVYGWRRFAADQSLVEVPVSGTGYSLFVHEQGASLFLGSEVAVVQARLKKMGVDTALLEWFGARSA